MVGKTLLEIGQVAVAAGGVPYDDAARARLSKQLDYAASRFDSYEGERAKLLKLALSILGFGGLSRLRRSTSSACVTSSSNSRKCYKRQMGGRG